MAKNPNNPNNPNKVLHASDERADGRENASRLCFSRRGIPTHASDDQIRGVFVRMYICMYRRQALRVYVCMCKYVYVCMYVCMLVLV